MDRSNRRKFLKLSGLLGLSSYADGQPLNASANDPDRRSGKLEEIRRQALKKYKPIFNMSGYAAPKIDTVKVGFIGVGNRGAAAVRRVSQIEGVSVKAICDVRKQNAESARLKVKVKPDDATLYFGTPDAWKKVCERDDIDLIYICTPWSLHVDMAVYAMEHGKHVAVEVPAAKTVEECWKLVLTSEKTRKHCVMLENCCYDFFELMTLNMARRNFFGDIIHCEGAYIHDLLESLFDQNARYEHWRLTENATRNGNLYPTHGFGPICQVLKINRGNRLEYMSSMASKDFSLGPMAAEKADTDPYVKQIRNAAFRGNMNTSTIMTHSGATVMLQHDVSSPRPYSRLHVISGTKAYAQKYPLPAKIALGHEKFVSDEEMKKLEAEYTPGIVNRIGEIARQVGGHGGMDFIMDWRLIDCLRRGLPVDMDVYDAAAWSVIGPLSEYSAANGSQPIQIPDFTMGRWQNNKVHDINLKD